MIRRFAALLAVFCLFSWLPAGALATEGTEEGFVSPTRPPTAAEYNEKKPEELQDDQIVARSFILMERSTGKVLRWRNMDDAIYPASTTKILTALIGLKYGDLNDTIEIKQSTLDLPEDASRVPFKLGEVVTLRDALYGMMLKSGNEAANAIAEYVSGDQNAFAGLMNEEARALGCTSTNFTNANGLHNDAHYTTAHDLALMMNAALDHPEFRKIIASQTYSLSATTDINGKPVNAARSITNSNLHILETVGGGENNDRYYPPSIGGKTGFTNQAGYCLVEAAEQDGVELIAVVLYSGKYTHWPDTSWLFRYGFSQYKSVTPEDMYAENPLEDIQINGFALDDRVPDEENPGQTKLGLGRLDLDIRAVDPTRDVRITGEAADIDAISASFMNTYAIVNYTTELRAPITQGQVVGILTFYPDGQEPAEYELIATRSIAARADAPLTLEEIEQRVLADPSPLPPFGWDWVLPPIFAVIAFLLILRSLLKSTLRRRRNKKQIPKPKRRYYS